MGARCAAVIVAIVLTRKEGRESSGDGAVA